MIQEPRRGEEHAVTPTFRRIAVWAAALAAVQSVSYTVSFALFVRRGYRWAHWASAIALMVTALLVVPVFVALYERLRGAEPELALIALITGVAGVLGATLHGAFDVAVLANPVTEGSDLPSQVDPRGFLTFAVTGLALALFGILALRSARPLGYAGITAGLVLIVVYLGRLTALDPNNNVIRVGALVSGLVAIPAFFLLAVRAALQPDD